MRQSYLQRRAQDGFTLLEILVTVVIFSVGLLGIAGLQMNGIRHTHNSHLRALATIQAENMAERMRANRTGVEIGKEGLNTNGSYNINTIPTNSPDCDTSPCTSADIANFDLIRWNAANAAILPSGTGIVCIDSTPSTWGCDDTGNVYVIKIQWTERVLDEAEATSAGAGTITQRFFMRVIPWS